jgi:hypothetical protein
MGTLSEKEATQINQGAGQSFFHYIDSRRQDTRLIKKTTQTITYFLNFLSQDHGKG